MERQEYLQYFFNNKNKPSSKTIYNQHNISKQSRSLHLTGHRMDKKLLPHIAVAEEYQYKITNQLLVHKIMNPKRDKLITQNFPKSISRPNTRQTKNRENSNHSYENKIKSLDYRPQKEVYPKPEQISLHNKIRIRQNLSRKKYKNIKSYEQQFHIALQNDRMGRRIINTKSSVQQILKKTFYTYKCNTKSKDTDKQNLQSELKNSSYIQGRQDRKYYFSGKINNGVKVFFNEIINDEDGKQSAGGLQSHSRSLTQSRLEQKFNLNREQENTQICIKKQRGRHQKRQNARQVKTSANFRSRSKDSNIVQKEQIRHIQTHYPQSYKVFGKGPTILMIYYLEIKCNPVLKDDSLLLFELITHQKRVTLKRYKQKSIRTTPICYNFFKMSGNDQISNCLRFAINVSEIGDFVPLRIYRVHGVQLQQLGIIDIDLAAFRYRKTELLNDQNQKIITQYKINQLGQKLQRQVISGSLQGSLRKNLLNKPVQMQVKLSYKIYPKRFKNISYIHPQTKC